MAKKLSQKSDRNAAAMCGAASPDAEYAGMAVQPADGGRSKPAAGSEDKQTGRHPQRLSLWLSASLTGYSDGNHVPHGSKGAPGPIYSVLHHRTQTQCGCTDPGGTGSPCAGRIHSQCRRSYQAGHHLYNGLRRGLVCVQSLPQ